MEKSELKNRIDKADERTINLFKRYPIVGALVLLFGVAIGLAIGAMIWAS